MEGITEKISRLPPELRREVEDYIDFLLSRQSSCTGHEPAPDFLIPPSPSAPSKPIILADEIPFRRDPEILPGYKDLGPVADLAGKDEEKKDLPVRLKKSQSSESGKKLLDWID